MPVVGRNWGVVEGPVKVGVMSIEESLRPQIFLCDLNSLTWHLL